MDSSRCVLPIQVALKRFCTGYSGGSHPRFVERDRLQGSGLTNLLADFTFCVRQPGIGRRLSARGGSKEVSPVSAPYKPLHCFASQNGPAAGCRKVDGMEAAGGVDCIVSRIQLPCNQLSVRTACAMLAGSSLANVSTIKAQLAACAEIH